MASSNAIKERFQTRGRNLVSHSVVFQSSVLGFVSFLLYVAIIGQGAFQLLTESYVLLSWLLILSPPFIASLTYLSMARDAQGELHELLILTNLADREIVHGYVVKALRRFQIVFAIGIGILPLLVLCEFGANKMSLMETVRQALNAPNSACTYMPDECQYFFPSVGQNIELNNAGQLFLTISQTGFIGVAALLGIAEALRRRRLASPIGVLFVWCVFSVPTALSAWIFATLPFPLAGRGASVLLCLAWAAIPYLAIPAILKGMESFVRRQQ